MRQSGNEINLLLELHFPPSKLIFMKLTQLLAGKAFIVLLLASGSIKAQTEFNPKIGLETWSIRDELGLSGSSRHTGQTIGFDVFVINNRFLFVPGFHYHRISILNGDKSLVFEIPDRNGTHYFSIPVTFGMKLIDLPGIDLSLMAGGEVTFFHSLDDNDIFLDDDELKSVFGGLTATAQVEIVSLITLDVKYHHQLHPMFKERAQSKLRGWTFAAGIRF
jgi:hypothetical protein